jgi:hypothetical protein
MGNRWRGIASGGDSTLLCVYPPYQYKLTLDIGMLDVVWPVEIDHWHITPG